MTTRAIRPVRTGRPPMISGISTRSSPIDARRALSSARSVEPGAYILTGSFSASGGRRAALNAAISVIEGTSRS